MEMTDLEVYRHMGQVTSLDIILRLLGAVVVGFAVGAQRAHTSHPAGIRTHILVALGSCVVMITSCIMYTQTIELFGTSPSDPARLGAQVINGIGFLGAGAILREGFTVRGLTTAASVWVVACLGLAVGMGYYVLTALGTVVSFVTLVAFDGIQQRIRTTGRSELDCPIWPSAARSTIPISSAFISSSPPTDMSGRWPPSSRSWRPSPG